MVTKIFIDGHHDGNKLSSDMDALGYKIITIRPFKDNSRPVKEAIKDSGPIIMDEVYRIAELMGEQVAELMLRTNKEEVVLPKYIVYFLLKKKYGPSEIGRVFGVAHCTVVYGAKQVVKHASAYPEFKRLVDLLFENKAIDRQDWATILKPYRLINAIL